MFSKQLSISSLWVRSTGIGQAQAAAVLAPHVKKVKQNNNSVVLDASREHCLCESTTRINLKPKRTSYRKVYLILTRIQYYLIVNYNYIIKYGSSTTYVIHNRSKLFVLVVRFNREVCMSAIVNLPLALTSKVYDSGYETFRSTKNRNIKNK